MFSDREIRREYLLTLAQRTPRFTVVKEDDNVWRQREHVSFPEIIEDDSARLRRLKRERRKRHERA